jgi:hypothetical protein
MKFEILFTELSDVQYEELENSKDKKSAFKAVRKILGYMETNLRHPSLNTHKFDEFVGPEGKEIFESYAQNRTPGAYRVFWYYGPEKGQITILDISPHL